MQIKFKDDEVLIDDLPEFSPKHIFECGQAFRWEVTDEGYEVIAHKRRLEVIRNLDTIILRGTDREDFENIWRYYFDLDRDYSKLRSELTVEPTLIDAMEYGWGIRILNQEEFETIITFIISANNQIRNIKSSVEKIAKLYGKRFYDNNREYFSFPDAKTLAQADPMELREIARVGFRAERIVESAKLIADKKVDLEEIKNADISLARDMLKRLPGVGDKVCDCILLFAFNRKEAFPVDVWIKRVMEELFIKKVTPKTKIADMGREFFGKNAGFVNQYLFYYGREHSIGK